MLAYEVSDLRTPVKAEIPTWPKAVFRVNQAAVKKIRLHNCSCWSGDKEIAILFPTQNAFFASRAF